MRCTGIDPSDRTGVRRKRGKRSRGSPKLNFRLMVRQIMGKLSRRMEKKALRLFIRRNYLEPVNGGIQMEPLLPFPLIVRDDAVAPDPRNDDISFCSLCDSEVLLDPPPLIRYLVCSEDHLLL